jgi:hypothetical protein
MSGRKTASKIGTGPRAALRPETPGATAAPWVINHLWNLKTSSVNH